MKTAFFTALTFGLILGLMGIFFGYVIYIGGTELREINTELIIILGLFVTSSISAIIITTPLTNPQFWSNLDEQKRAIIETYKEAERLRNIRKKYEQKLSSNEA